MTAENFQLLNQWGQICFYRKPPQIVLGGVISNSLLFVYARCLITVLQLGRRRTRESKPSSSHAQGLPQHGFV